MQERDLEKILVDEVKKAGGIAYKWVSPGNDGVPDRIVILPGMPVQFVELKVHSGKPTKLQKVQMDRLEKLGQRVFLSRGLFGLEAFFLSVGMTSAADKVRGLFDEELRRHTKKKREVNV